MQVGTAWRALANTVADFPALQPTSRVFTPGIRPNSAITVLTGDELLVGHSSATVNYYLQLGFIGLTTDEHFELTSHYVLHGTFQAFDLSSSILLGSGLTFPSGYQWFYRGAPQTSYEPGIISVDVELELAPPYTL